MGADEYLRCVRDIRLDTLELMGSEYVIEYCASVYSDNHKRELFESYIADGIMNINSILAECYGGSYLTTRLSEIGEPEDERTGDEIALEIIERAGLVVR